jgi:hypothetical protein
MSIYSSHVLQMNGANLLVQTNGAELICYK